MSEEMKSAVAAVEKVNKAFEEFKSANDERLAELESKGASDPLIEEKLGRIEDSLDKAQKTADAAVLAQKRRERVVTDADGNEIDLDAKAADWKRSASGNPHAVMDGAQMTAYKSAFNHYLRKGDRGMDATEFKALSEGVDADGGFTVHPDLTGRITSFVYESSPMRAYASAQMISTSELEGLYDNDEAASGWVAETDARPNTDTPQLGRWVIPVHELYANPEATQKILDDSTFNMEQWLANKVSSKFARDESLAFVSGDGTGKPTGFLNYDDYTTPGVSAVDQIERFKTGVDGDFAAAPNGGDVLIEALYGLKSPYRMNATWFLNRTTTRAVRKLKDSDGAYLWQAGIAAGQPATILGYPTAPFDDMPNPAAGSLSIAVGDMREAYQIVDRFGIRTLRDPYSNKPYVGFYSTKRVGGDVVNFEALKLVEFSVVV